MGFQVNGTTIIDSSRNFSSSAFGTTVNGNNLVGTGDIKYVRPGVSTLHVVGDYILCGHNNQQSFQNNVLSVNAFDGGTTHAGSGFNYSNYTPEQAFARWRPYTALSPTLSGTWRCTQAASYTQDYLNWACHGIFFARIS